MATKINLTSRGSGARVLGMNNTAKPSNASRKKNTLPMSLATKTKAGNAKTSVIHSPRNAAAGFI
jgi:hypothetical protein